MTTSPVAVVVQTTVTVRLGILRGTSIELLPGEPLTLSVPDPALLTQVPAEIERQRLALAAQLAEAAAQPDIPAPVEPSE